MTTHENEWCCADMMSELTRACPEHPSPSECPDVLLRQLKSREIGIVIHDGGESVRVIRFCPFCGKELPRARRKSTELEQARAAREVERIAEEMVAEFAEFAKKPRLRLVETKEEEAARQ